MADKTFDNIRIKHKMDTSSNWDSKNPAINKGEIAIESDVSYISGDTINNDGTTIHVGKTDTSHVDGNDETAVFIDKKQAITKINTDVKSYIVDCSNEEYNNLPSTKYTDNKIYFIPDGEESEQADIDVVFGFHIDPTESDPYEAVTYIADAAVMTPAKMIGDKFSYGSWFNVFFMPRPCMVKYDGTVDYYLDPNNYKLKKDGTPSDVGNINYDGNAMMEWPLIWYKYDTDGCIEGEVNFYVSNKQVDDSYHCWCNYDFDGNIIPHFYTAIYNGTSAPIYSNESTYSVGDRVTYSSREYECKTDVTVAEEWNSSKWTLISTNTRLRSLSGVQLTQENGNGYTTDEEEITRAQANNVPHELALYDEWYTDILADRELINMLLVLIGKSLNAQVVFGRGLDNGSQAAKEAYVTGTLDDKGLFWGVTTNDNSAVKVFGMENYWGCVLHRVAGMVNVHDATTNSNTIKIKLTHSTVMDILILEL